jgi:hypothetical protein
VIGAAQREKLKPKPFKSSANQKARGGPAVEIDIVRSLEKEQMRKNDAVEKTKVLSLQRELSVVQQRFDEATREVTVLEKLSARLDMQSGVVLPPPIVDPLEVLWGNHVSTREKVSGLLIAILSKV